MTSVGVQYDDLMNPTLQALRELGGSGTNEEINSKVVEIAKISPEELDILHNPSKGGMTEVEYRLMWTRTYLKKYGLIENSTRGVWSLTPKGSTIEYVDKREIVKVVRELRKKEKEIPIESYADHIIEWQEELLDVISTMPPQSFERLIQRLLRESGFIQVQVTGLSFAK